MGEPRSGQVDEVEARVDLVEVQRLGLAGFGRDPGRLLAGPSQNSIDQRRLADVGAARERDLRQLAGERLVVRDHRRDEVDVFDEHRATPSGRLGDLSAERWAAVVQVFRTSGRHRHSHERLPQHLIHGVHGCEVNAVPYLIR